MEKESGRGDERMVKMKVCKTVESRLVPVKCKSHCINLGNEEKPMPHSGQD